MKTDYYCGTLIRNISNLWDMRVDESLKVYGLSIKDVLVLLRLYKAQEHILSMKELETELCASQPDIARITKRLEEKGFVEKSVDPEDQRVKKVRLTNAGVLECETATKEMEAGNEILLAGMSKEERETLKSLLLKAYENSLQD